MESANRSQIFVVFLVAALVVLLAWAGIVRVELAGHSRADYGLFTIEGVGSAVRGCGVAAG